MEHELVFPVEVRPGVIVRIVGIPHDMTKQEAERVAGIVSAMAVVDPKCDQKK